VLIQEQGLWEIRNGATTKFWEESWMQYPKLSKEEKLREIQVYTIQLGAEKVNDIRHLASPNPKWMEWESADEWLEREPPMDWEALSLIL